MGVPGPDAKGKQASEVPEAAEARLGRGDGAGRGEDGRRGEEEPEPPGDGWRRRQVTITVIVTVTMTASGAARAYTRGPWLLPGLSGLRPHSLTMTMTSLGPALPAEHTAAVRRGLQPRPACRARARGQCVGALALASPCLRPALPSSEATAERGPKRHPSGLWLKQRQTTPPLHREQHRRQRHQCQQWHQRQRRVRLASSLRRHRQRRPMPALFRVCGKTAVYQVAPCFVDGALHDMALEAAATSAAQAAARIAALPCRTSGTASRQP